MIDVVRRLIDAFTNQRNAPISKLPREWKMALAVIRHLQARYIVNRVAMRVEER